MFFLPPFLFLFSPSLSHLVPLSLFLSFSPPPANTTQIDADVEESRSIVKYMRRCCLFFLCSCCCECDPDAERDALRHARVRARRTARKKEAEALARIEERKRAAAVGEAAAAEEAKGGKKGGKGGKKGNKEEEAPKAAVPPRRDPRLDDPSTEDAARAQLFGGAGASSSSALDDGAPSADRSGAAFQLGGALAAADREAGPSPTSGRWASACRQS